ncbi:MAG: hypothetical protein ABMA01_11865 [Chthoniobacteraceae bacterium]
MAETIQKLSRGEAIEWIAGCMPMCPVPEEFREDFRPLSIPPPPSTKGVRESFLHLAGVALKECANVEDRAPAALSIMQVATALGFKDEAREAATIVNAYNAAECAASSLADMLAAPAKSKTGAH